MKKAKTILIGKTIQALRKSNGYTQEKLAEKVDLSAENISGIETDRIRPSYEVLIRICNLFGIGLDQIFQAYLDLKPEEKCTYSLAGFDKLSEKDKETIVNLIMYFNKKENNK